MRLHYEIKGMSCAACVSHVERAIRSVLSDKDTFTVSLLTNSVSIITAEDEVNVKALEERLSRAVAAGGYTLVTNKDPNEKTPPKAPKNAEFAHRVRVLVASAVLTLLVMYLAMGPMLGIPIPPFLSGAENGIWMALAQFVITLPVLILNRKFFISGFRALFHLVPNMDSLIAVGSGASVIYGLIAIILIATATDHEAIHTYLHDLYFESAAMILTLVSLGKLLESRAKDRAADAVKSLSAMTPASAAVLRDGVEISLPVEELQVGDLVLIRAGEWIPVDGTVTSGAGSTDESALTGESMPVEKEIGSPVRAACILTSGAITVRAEGVGEESSLSRIIRLLEDAAASKAPIARIADKVSAVFVPIVMGISLVTFSAWMLATQNVEQALRSAIAVLVISCPCALGLATPTAITVGVGRGAREGILFRNAEALEKLCSVKTVMFDKTGTLTEGKPSLTDLITVDPEPIPILSVAASIERLSAHPLALAIRMGAEALELSDALEVTDFESKTAVGAVGRIGGALYTVGKPASDFLAQSGEKDAKTHTCVEKTFSGIRILSGADPTYLPSYFEDLERMGKTAVVLTRNGEAVAVLGISDRIRTDSPAAVKALQGAGVRCVMLTGDNARTAATVAKTLSLDAYHAACLPEDKERLVREEASRSSVAMVGDGINDAPALVRADVGIAVGAGTDVAMDSAGVVLSSSSLFGVADAYLLSRATIRIIKQNLFWALFYNAICIPVAAGVFFPLLGWQLSPMLASAAMSFSSVCVVTNALRLRSISLIKKGENTTMFAKKELITHEIHVEGMMCPRCVAHVKTALEGVKGVKSVTVNLDSKTATVTAPSNIQLSTLTAAIVVAGYEVV